MSEVSPLGAAEVVGRERFLDLLDRLPQAVVILAEDGTVLFWSSGAETLFGYRSDEMLAASADPLLTPQLRSSGETARLLAHGRAGGDMRDFETERLTRDGRTLSVLLTQSPLRGPDGSFQGIFQALTDISEHKALLRALERRVHQLSIVKEIGEALYGTMDLDEVLHLILVGVTAGPGLRFNRAFLLLADENGSVLRGRLAIGPSDPEEAHRIWQELSQTPMTLKQMLRKYERSLAETNVPLNRIVRELVLTLDDDTSGLATAIRSGMASVFRSEEMLDPDRDLASRLGTGAFAIAPLSARGRTIGALLADNAITGREIQSEDLEVLQLLAATASAAVDNSRLYEELGRRLSHLEAARVEARRSQQAVLRAERLSTIGEMAALVAHDIRNPLAAIGGFARSLLAKARHDDAARGPLGVIVEEVSRLEGILTKVLDRARPEPPDAQTVQMNPIIEEAVKLLEEELRDGRVRVSLSLDPGLPAIAADSDRIFEMVLNLLRNAMQAMPMGGSLTVLTLPAGDAVELQFADTGLGIPEDIRSRIFSPFFTTKPTGSGLGLTIVEQIVREHGGTIDLHSAVGIGSTFTVKLPSRKHEADHDQSPVG